jgi:hypothetical protein
VHNAGILRLRRRSLWEAADSGLLLWRRNLGYFIPFFAIPLWICAFALRFLPALAPQVLLPPQDDSVISFPGGLPLIWSWAILWWLNPLFDRLILHVAAKRFFEPQVSFRRIFQGLGKSLGRGLAGDLLWRRLSPWRAAVLPLRLLEQGPGGRRLRERKRALSQGGLHFCIFLTGWCFTLQWILLAGEALFVLMISGLFFNVQLSGFTDIFLGKGLYYYTAWCVNYLVVESLYVCMGFGLYLNSRVEVEGWDIELLFRKFTARRARGE